MFGECLAGVCGYIDFFGMIILNFLILKIDMEPVLYQIWITEKITPKNTARNDNAATVPARTREAGAANSIGRGRYYVHCCIIYLYYTVVWGIGLHFSRSRRR